MSQSFWQLGSCWMAHQPTIHIMVTSMEELARLLREQSGPRVICHADLHPGNILCDQTDHVFVIDWDDVMLAPKEGFQNINYELYV